MYISIRLLRSITSNNSIMATDIGKTPEDVFNFWFGNSLNDGKMRKIWFSSGAEDDLFIKEKFGDLVLYSIIIHFHTPSCMPILHCCCTNYSIITLSNKPISSMGLKSYQVILGLNRGSSIFTQVMVHISSFFSTNIFSFILYIKLFIFSLGGKSS